MTRVTIEDVATRAGVSIKTVSRVVNREPNVRPAMRAKVEEAIRALNYSPNRFARSLAGNRSYLLGLLYSNPVPNYIFEVQNGSLSACKTHGYGLIIHPCDYQDSKLSEELLALVRQTQVDGLILTPPLSDRPELIRVLDQNHIPYVRVVSAEHAEGSPCVFCDDRKACSELTEHLVELGHQKIGFIAGHPDHGGSHERFEGYRDGLKGKGISFTESLVQQGYFDFDSGKQAALALLSKPQRPTAIFASNDDMAAATILAAHELGINVPRQLSVVGFDDGPIAQQIWPRLTTVRQPITAMAKASAELLIKGLRNEEVDEKEKAFKCNIVYRESTAAPAV